MLTAAAISWRLVRHFLLKWRRGLRSCFRSALPKAETVLQRLNSPDLQSSRGIKYSLAVVNSPRILDLSTDGAREYDWSKSLLGRNIVSQLSLERQVLSPNGLAWLTLGLATLLESYLEIYIDTSQMHSSRTPNPARYGDETLWPGEHGRDQKVSSVCW